MTTSRVPTLARTLATVSAMMIVAAACSVSVGVGGEEGSGTVITTSHQAEGFDRIDVASAFDVEVNVDPTAEFSVETETDDNLADRVDVTVEGDTLRIKLKPRSRIDPTRLRADITVPSLRSVAASGASSVSVRGTLDGPVLGVESTGASDITVSDVQTTDVAVDAAGASNVSVSGSASAASAEASGASSIDLGALDVADIDVRATGASTISVSASGEVSGRAQGASTVDVSGEASVDVDTSGASTVRR